MGNRCSIQFYKKEYGFSPVLCDHWGGKDFADEALYYAKKLKEWANGHEGEPLQRFEPQIVIIDFLRHLLENHVMTQRITSSYYLAVSENDVDNSDNGHFIINLDDFTMKRKRQ